MHSLMAAGSHCIALHLLLGKQGNCTMASDYERGPENVRGGIAAT